MAITSFYLLNMFPQMRTLHHHPTINTQHPSQTCSLSCALYIITQQSTPNTQAKHVPSDAHFTSSPNNQHPTPKPKHVPSDAHFYIISQQSTTNTLTKHVPSDAHFTSSPNNQHPSPKQNMFPQMRTLSSSPNNQHPSPNSHDRDSIDFSIKLAC